jgi:hypothetical protein
MLAGLTIGIACTGSRPEGKPAAACADPGKELLI